MLVRKLVINFAKSLTTVEVNVIITTVGFIFFNFVIIALTIKQFGFTLLIIVIKYFFITILKLNFIINLEQYFNSTKFTTNAIIIIIAVDVIVIS